MALEKREIPLFFTNSTKERETAALIEGCLCERRIGSLGTLPMDTKKERLFHLEQAIHKWEQHILKQETFQLHLSVEVPIAKGERVLSCCYCKELGKYFVHTEKFLLLVDQTTGHVPWKIRPKVLVGYSSRHFTWCDFTLPPGGIRWKVCIFQYSSSKNAFLITFIDVETGSVCMTEAWSVPEGIQLDFPHCRMFLEHPNGQFVLFFGQCVFTFRFCYATSKVIPTSIYQLKWEFEVDLKAVFPIVSEEEGRILFLLPTVDQSNLWLFDVAAQGMLVAVPLPAEKVAFGFCAQGNLVLLNDKGNPALIRRLNNHSEGEKQQNCRAQFPLFTEPEHEQ